MSGEDMKVAHNSVISDFYGRNMTQNRPQIDKLFFEDALINKYTIFSRLCVFCNSPLLFYQSLVITNYLKIQYPLPTCCLNQPYIHQRFDFGFQGQFQQ